MAKRRAARDGYPKPAGATRGRPRQQNLIEDRAIKPLEDQAEDYADIRDRRMEAGKEEVTAKKRLLELMKKHGKEKYHRGGITVQVIHEKESVRVRVRKAVDAEPADEDVDATPDQEPSGEAEFVDEVAR